MSRAPHRRSVGLRPPTRCESLTEIPHRLSAYHPVALALDRCGSLPLRLWQIDAVLAEFLRTLGEATSAPIALVRRRGRIDHLIDHLRCQLRSTGFVRCLAGRLCSVLVSDPSSTRRRMASCASVHTGQPPVWDRFSTSGVDWVPLKLHLG